jgi:hypothetical protein
MVNGHVVLLPLHVVLTILLAIDLLLQPIGLGLDLIAFHLHLERIVVHPRLRNAAVAVLSEGRSNPQAKQGKRSQRGFHSAFAEPGDHHVYCSVSRD